jgi:MoCo/4Fe-4S cofactor protein with predicted Tat translocation signal
MSAPGTTVSAAPKAGLTLAEARAQLGQARGRQYWRTLEELAASNSFRQMVQREFPRQAAAVADWEPVDRRDFLRLMGASLAFAGLTACTKQHPEKIVPERFPEARWHQYRAGARRSTASKGSHAGVGRHGGPALRLHARPRWC